MINRGIDWYEIANQHKEFAGHTGASLSSMFTDLLQAVKKSKKGGVVSLQDVANYAAKERKTSPNSISQSQRSSNFVLQGKSCYSWNKCPIVYLLFKTLT